MRREQKRLILEGLETVLDRKRNELLNRIRGFDTFIGRSYRGVETPEAQFDSWIETLKNARREIEETRMTIDDARKIPEDK